MSPEVITANQRWFDMHTIDLFYSSPELKSTVSCRPYVNFSHFHLLLQNQVGSNEGPFQFPWEHICEIAKIHWQHFESFFCGTSGPILTKFGTNISVIIVDFYVLYDESGYMQIWALLTRDQSKVSDTQVTVKPCGILVFITRKNNNKVK